MYENKVFLRIFLYSYVRYAENASLKLTVISIISHYKHFVS